MWFFPIILTVSVVRLTPVAVSASSKNVQSQSEHKITESAVDLNFLDTYFGSSLSIPSKLESENTIQIKIYHLNGESMCETFTEPITTQKLYTTIGEERLPWTEKMIFKLTVGNDILDPSDDQKLALHEGQHIGLIKVYLENLKECEKDFLNFNHCFFEYGIKNSPLYSDYFLLHFAVQKNVCVLKSMYLKTKKNT